MLTAFPVHASPPPTSRHTQAQGTDARDTATPASRCVLTHAHTKRTREMHAHRDPHSGPLVHPRRPARTGITRTHTRACAERADEQTGRTGSPARGGMEQSVGGRRLLGGGQSSQSTFVSEASARSATWLTPRCTAWGRSPRLPRAAPPRQGRRGDCPLLPPSLLPLRLSQCSGGRGEVAATCSARFCSSEPETPGWVYAARAGASHGDGCFGIHGLEYQEKRE